jgi:phage/plasmid-like protein (TIGR03299 family)
MRTFTPEQVDSVFSWNIESLPCYARREDGQLLEVKGKRALVRADNGFGLGVVTKSYGIIQPQSMMSLLHAAAGDGIVEYINGGAFDGGKRIYLQVALKGANFDIAGQEHGAYFMLGAHNDGSGSFWAAFTPTRLFCMNQLRVAIKNIISRFSIRHTKNASERLAVVEEVITRARGYFGAFHAEALNLVRQRFTIQDMRSLTEELWPTPKSENLLDGVVWTRNRVVQLFDGAQIGGSALMGTKYGALNAVAEYVDHHQNRRGGEAGRLNAVLFGSQPTALKQLAYERLAA